MNKVVYNSCYGGFSLSPLAVKLYYEKKYPDVHLYFYKMDFGGLSCTKVNPEALADCDSFSIEIFTHDFGDSIQNVFDKDLSSYRVYLEHEVDRHDLTLVQVVEELGLAADGRCAELSIAEIEGNLYRIDEYDGRETIVEPSDEEWIHIEG